jgi:uncharacterized protein
VLEGAAAPQLAVLNCLTGFETHRNPYFSAAVASAINDWMRDEMLARDDRLRASLVVSTVSTEDAVGEIERLGDDPRFVQVLLPVRGDLPWGHKINQPIAQAQVLSFVSEGVFERFPDLRVVLTECGFAWLAPLLWRFDKDWKGVWREVPWLKRRPSEYVVDHFCFTTAPAHLPDDAAAVGQLLEMMDVPGMLTYASDYPHDHGDGMSMLLDQLSEDERRRVLWGNAATLYGL